jgi:hypothetical protein
MYYLLTKGRTGSQPEKLELHEVRVSVFEIHTS